MDSDQIQGLNDIILKEDETEPKKLFFIKTYQRLFDDDRRFNFILKKPNLLPLNLFEEIDTLFTKFKIKLENIQLIALYYLYHFFFSFFSFSFFFNF